MADYFTQFSTAIDLDDDEKQWALDLYAKLRSLRAGEPTEGDEDILQLAQDLYKANDEWFGFECVDNPDGDGIWLTEDESVNEGMLGGFIQRILQKFDIKEPVAIEFAYICSKPRLDGFGGAAMVVTQDEVLYHGTRDWIDETIKRLTKTKKD